MKLTYQELFTCLGQRIVETPLNRDPTILIDTYEPEKHGMYGPVRAELGDYTFRDAARLMVDTVDCAISRADSFEIRRVHCSVIGGK